MPDQASSNPFGVWVAQPIAWDENERFDPARYASDIAYMCSTGVHGVYSGGTTGEFYALDFEEFVATNSVMLKTAGAAGTAVQVGVTATSTREVLRRTEWAVDNGADGVQVALPYWLEMGDDEVLEFFGDVGRAAGDAYIVNYATARSKRTISPELFKTIRRDVPALLGLKLGGDRVDFIKSYLEALPEFAIFVGEAMLCEATAMGARGTYSSVVMTNPGLILEFFEACRSGDNGKAETITERIRRFHDDILVPFIRRGYWDSALDRLQAMLNPNMSCGLRCRRPYKFFSPEDLDRARSWLTENDPELLCL